MVGLAGGSRRQRRTFSGGMKRRVGIAQALLNDPRLLIVDEPTAGLDPEERIRFRNLLAGLAGDHTVLLSTHVVEDIAQTTRQLAVLNSGRAIFRGSVADLVGSARGNVWMVTAPEALRPEGGVTVISTVRQGHVVHYRVVSGARPHVAQGEVVEAEPTLEERYLRLMQRHHLP